MSKKSTKVKVAALFNYEAPVRLQGRNDETDPTTTMITKTVSGIFIGPKKG